jgi:hypothetical protein
MERLRARQQERPCRRGGGALLNGCLYQLVHEQVTVNDRSLEMTFLDHGAEAYPFAFG